MGGEAAELQGQPGDMYFPEEGEGEIWTNPAAFRFQYKILFEHQYTFFSRIYFQ